MIKHIFSFLVIFFLMASPLKAEKPSEQVDIADITAVTDIPDSIEGGGFDYKVDAKGGRRVFYVPKLNDCSRKIENISLDWAKKNNLKIYNSTTKNGYLTMNCAPSDNSGIFQIYYSLSSDKTEAKIKFTFQSTSGSSTSGLNLKSIKSDSFVEQLREAISCSSGV